MLAPLPMTRREDDHVQEASAILLKRDVVKEVVPRPNRWFYHGVMGAKGWLKLVKEKGGSVVVKAIQPYGGAWRTRRRGFPVSTRLLRV
nr:hypothetical protein Iba_chr01aCG2440 [Ipomoea batatas]GMC56497.1 hypothetical protein Iba_chr01fCG7650 [Ipomoea batatas]